MEKKTFTVEGNPQLTKTKTSDPTTPLRAAYEPVSRPKELTPKDLKKFPKKIPGLPRHISGNGNMGEGKVVYEKKVIEYEDGRIETEERGSPQLTNIDLFDLGIIKYPDFEGFLKSLEMSCDSDDEIKIRVAEENPAFYGYTLLGCRNNSTEEWKLLITALSSEGKITIKRETDRKVLRRLNGKLVNFFNDRFSTKIPSKSKVYERRGKGAYQFKFSVVTPTHKKLSAWEERLFSYDKNQLEDEMMKLAKLVKGINSETYTNKLRYAYDLYKSRGYDPNNELKEQIKDIIKL